jgi:hypothetical protein
MHDSALEKQVTRLGDLERRILDEVMRHTPVARIESLLLERAAH